MRLEIAAGSPDAAEVAALSTALLVLGARTPAAPVRGSAWSRATRFEQVGQAPFHSRTDTRLVHRPSGSLSPGSQRSDD